MAEAKAAGTGVQPVVKQERCCVVLADSGGSAPVNLLSGLSKRGLALTVVAEPPSVMVALGKQPVAALIVVDAQRQPRIRNLVEAVRQYYPRTVCWQYGAADGQRRPKLSRIQVPFGQEPPQPDPKAPQAVASTEGAGQSLGRGPDPTRSKLCGNSGATSDRARQPLSQRLAILAVQAPQRARDSEVLISQEELAMLLGPVPEPEIPLGQAVSGEPPG